MGRSKITSYCICVWCESGEIGGRKSSRFTCVTSVAEKVDIDVHDYFKITFLYRFKN